MNKLLALMLLPLGVATFAVFAQPASQDSGANLARVEAADRQFLAAEQPAPPAPTVSIPPPAVVTAAPPPPVVAAPPPPTAEIRRAVAVESPRAVTAKRTERAEPPKAEKSTSKRKASAPKTAVKREPMIRRAIPVVRDSAFVVRTASQGGVITRRYEMPPRSQRGTVRVTTTTVTSRADRDDDDDEDEDEDDD